MHGLRGPLLLFMILYLDESGDLGFKFDSPYQQGGSSRYLSIAYIFLPRNKKYLPRRIVKDLYRRLHFPSNKELKSTSLGNFDKIHFAKKVVNILKSNDDIKIGAITVYKRNVLLLSFKHDKNLLYNYMVKLLTINFIKNYKEVILIPDEKSIKVERSRSLEDYLQMELWLEHQADTRIEYKPDNSKKNLCLKFVDYLVRIISDKYERNKDDAFNILSPYLDNRELFFY